MTLGIRPEHLTEKHEQEKPGVVHISIPVDVVEPMGMETMVHFLIDGTAMTARIDPAVHAAPGEMLPLAADMNQMHLIDNETNRVV
jgi:multiple sugar transport system ATP-binding protein